MSARELHVTAFRLQRLYQTEGLSRGQEWLFDALLSELAYRKRRIRSLLERCYCSLCCEWDAPVVDDF